ncbi:MAG TPA: hypothetical protein VID74_05565, partial [Gemmatimonadales bacterium]
IARLAAAAVLQVALGIATLLLVVPVTLGVAHQAGAIVLITAGLLSMHALRTGERAISPSAQSRSSAAS